MGVFVQKGITGVFDSREDRSVALEDDGQCCEKSCTYNLRYLSCSHPLAGTLRAFSSFESELILICDEADLFNHVFISGYASVITL